MWVKYFRSCAVALLGLSALHSVSADEPISFGTVGYNTTVVAPAPTQTMPHGVQAYHSGCGTYSQESCGGNHGHHQGGFFRRLHYEASADAHRRDIDSLWSGYCDEANECQQDSGHRMRLFNGHSNCGNCQPSIPACTNGCGGSGHALLKPAHFLPAFGRKSECDNGCDQGCAESVDECASQGNLFDRVGHFSLHRHRDHAGCGCNVPFGNFRLFPDRLGLAAPSISGCDEGCDGGHVGESKVTPTAPAAPPAPAESAPQANRLPQLPSLDTSLVAGRTIPQPTPIVSHERIQHGRSVATPTLTYPTVR
jgi:hypothetical protein